MSQLVDVIIPVHNGMPWLKATLSSVLAQTHQNIKVYVIDDGSTDDCEAYLKTIDDSRVTYIKKTNGGVSSARNLGIQKSSSEFVAFVDADDIWVPQKIEKQLALMSNEKVGLVYGHHYLIDEGDIILGNLRISKRGNLFDALCDGNCIAGSASMVLIRRELMNKVGLFREDLVNGEDWEYWLRLSQHCDIDFVPEIIASVRVHSKNAQGNIKRMSDGLIDVLNVILTTYKLTKNQHVRVSSYCLNNAINGFLAIRDYPAARRATRRLIKENPHALIDGSTWKIHIGFSLITRGLFTNKYMNFIIRKLKYLIKLPFKITRRLFGLFKISRNRSPS